MLKRIFESENRGLAMALKKPEITNITVIVTPSSTDNPCDITFGLGGKNGKVRSWKEPSDNKYHVSFENQGANGFIVLFNINDDNETGCVFRNVPHEAIWVQEGNQCPEDPCNWPQFVPIGVINDGRTLVVYNKNENPRRTYAFTLRFTSTDCNDLKFDPIGENMNGQ